MAKLYHLIRLTSPTTGTGTLALGPAVAGYLTFAQAGIPDGASVQYVIVDGPGNEMGRGIYDAVAGTLTRAVLVSTNGNAPLNLSGAAEVFVSEVGAGIVEDAKALGGTPADHFVQGSNPHRATQLPNGADLNADYPTGFYNVYAPLHPPVAGNIWWSLIQIRQDDPALFARQICIYLFGANRTAFTRYCNAGTWSNWNKFLITDDNGVAEANAFTGWPIASAGQIGLNLESTGDAAVTIFHRMKTVYGPVEAYLKTAAPQEWGILLDCLQGIYLGHNGANFSHFKSNGYVGINKVNPQYPLDVNGTIRSNSLISGNSMVVDKHIGQHYQVALADNATTYIGSIKLIDSASLVGSFLVSLAAFSAGTLATATYIVSIVWSNVVCSLLSMTHWASGTFTLSATVDTTNRRVNLNVSMNNDANQTQTVDVNILPLSTAGDAIISMEWI